MFKLFVFMLTCFLLIIRLEAQYRLQNHLDCGQTKSSNGLYFSNNTYFDYTLKNTTFKIGARAAVDGAKATEKIAARMGRAGTVGERSIGYPDAGAYALGVIFTELADALNSK